MHVLHWKVKREKIWSWMNQIFSIIFYQDNFDIIQWSDYGNAFHEHL